MEAPFGGKAWVSIETDEIIDQFVVDLKHNASKIEVPISEDHYPNAFVTVYLIRPGGPEKIPTERFGRVELNVIRKELNLDVNVVMDKSQIEPRDRGSGTIFITSNGKPIANADLTVMAVDEAVLKLGAWEIPPIIPRFYRERSHNVSTYHALDNHIEGFEEEDVTEKRISHRWWWNGHRPTKETTPFKFSCTCILDDRTQDRSAGKSRI